MMPALRPEVDEFIAELQQRAQVLQQRGLRATTTRAATTKARSKMRPSPSVSGEKSRKSPAWIGQTGLSNQILAHMTQGHPFHTKLTRRQACYGSTS